MSEYYNDCKFNYGHRCRLYHGHCPFPNEEYKLCGFSEEYDRSYFSKSNNNLFTNEIKKVGGFEEDEDDLCNAFDGKEDENDKKYHLQIKLYKNETPTSYTFVKGFDSHLLNKDVAGSLYDMISTLENDAYNVINKDIEEFVEEYFKKVE